MWESFFVEGLAFWLGVIITSLGATAYVSTKIKDWLTKHKLRRGVLATGDVYDKLQKLHHTLGAEKSLLIAAHNGGSFMNPLHPPHLTVLAEYHNADLDSNKEHWQNRIADYGIVTMLSELLQHKELVTTTDQMEGHIHTVMKKDGTEGIVVRFVGILGVMLVYCFFSFKEPKKLMPGEVVSIDDFVEQIKKTY